MENQVDNIIRMSTTYYRAVNAVSISYLNRLNVCPALAKTPQEETAAMLFGTAFHDVILSDGVTTIIMPDCDKRTKAGKDIAAQFVAANVDKTIISSDEMSTITAMQQSLLAHPFAARIITAKNKREASMFWIDDQSGLNCKGRAGIIDENIQAIFDIKTTKNAGYYGFKSSVHKFGYARQAVFYLDGYKAVIGDDFDFIFICVEPTLPHRVECYTIDEAWLDVARSDIKRLLELEKKCRVDGYPATTGRDGAWIEILTLN